ncbi:MAG: histidine kinase dimerization/phosphoacceptor domain -containing protein [Crocinitomicaceae bacterium]|nr:histidine kinase dimerization/phosphoacceptor domain -containing protein [Crocinitomicaceae bacterium]
MNKILLPYFGAVLLIALGSYCYGQDYIHKADSLELLINNESGRKRIELIANITRNTNLLEVDHKVFGAYIQEAYEWEKKNPNPKLLNTIRLGEVNYLIADSEDVAAVECLHSILNSGVPLSSKDSISTYSFLRNLYSSAHLYSEAWETLRILDQVIINSRSNDPFFVDSRKNIFNDFAMIYLQMEEYDKAIEQLKKLIRIAHQENDLLREAGAYNNLGITFLKLEEPDSAIFYFYKSEDLWGEYIQSLTEVFTADEAFFSILKGNIGEAHNQNGAYRKAIPLLQEYLERGREDNNPGMEINALHELSKSYVGLKEYSKAYGFLEEAALLLEGNSVSDDLIGNYQLKVDVLEKLGRSGEALKLFRLVVTYQDSINDLENRDRVIMLEFVYGLDKKNIEIGQQKVLVAEARADTEKEKGSRRVLIISVVMMSVILTLLVLYVFQKRKRTKALTEKSEQIEKQNEIIEASLVEKDILLKEIHHRVKNNLQLISGILELQAAQFDDKDLKAVMEEGQSRVRSMSLIHEQLYQSKNLGVIDFQKYLEKLVKDIVVAFKDQHGKLDIDINVNGLSFDVNLSVPLGLIVNEMITNAFKHGFVNRQDGKISILIEEIGDNKYEMLISDNGHGLPGDFDPEKSASLGLRLVKGLSRQLGGDYSFYNQNGANFVIQFKTTNI